MEGFSERNAVMNEKLLEAWLKLTTAIVNERVVSDLPYNESVICNILYKNHCRTPDSPITATDLCQKMKMQKSQMNRTLSSMEEKGLICRERSLTDRRQVLVRLNMDQLEVYQGQHERILALIDRLLEQIGPEKAGDIVDMFTQIANTAEEIIK